MMRRNNVVAGVECFMTSIFVGLGGDASMLLQRQAIRKNIVSLVLASTSI